MGGRVRDGGLTERVREVLALRATGKTVPELAAALCITERTANFHLANIYAKLGLEHLAPGERQLRLAEHGRKLPGRARLRKKEETATMTPAAASPTGTTAGSPPRHPVTRSA